MADFDNPLTDLRLLVATAMTEYPAFVTAVGGENNIQVWERTVDVRGDLKKGAAKRRAVLWNSRATIDFDFSSSAIRSTRIFAVDLRVRDQNVKVIEYLEWCLTRALARLYMNLKADGTGNWTAPAPLVINSIMMTEADPERETVGADTDQWTAMCDIVVTFTAALADLIA